MDNQDHVDVDNRTENGFRFSASYAARYHNCHGSARLSEAIEGFEYPERNDNGMKGEGTRLHEIFEEALSDTSNLVEKAKLLRAVAGINWRERDALLSDEKKYIVWWFMQHKQAPPLGLELIAKAMLHKKPKIDVNGNHELDEMGNEVWVRAAAPPRRVVFLAECLEYVHDILKDMDDDVEVLSEVKATAEWLSTKPKTTVDLILKDQHVMHVLDLKMGEVEVSPIENTQLMYYAWTFGAVNYDSVRLHIMQRGFTDHWDVSRDTLHEWSNEMKESERAILAHDLTLTVGDHCKFCPANPHSRGDKGNKACPVMMHFLYGERDAMQSDQDVLEEDDD